MLYDMLDVTTNLVGLAHIFCMINLCINIILCVHYTQGELILYLVFFYFHMVSRAKVSC